MKRNKTRGRRGTPRSMAITNKRGEKDLNRVIVGKEQEKAFVEVLEGKIGMTPFQ